MSKKKETKKVSIFSLSECFAFMIGDVPCVVYFEPLLDKVTFTGTGDELPKIGECLKFLREHFNNKELLEHVKNIVVESITW